MIGAILVAIGIVALYWSMFYNAGYQSGYNERKAKVESAHYASDTANQIDRKCSTKTGEAARECITEIIGAERESQRGESDLAAQWKAADWVMWAGILAGAQLIATVLGLYFVKRTLDATLEAVEDTGKATVAMERQNVIASEAQRAWVTISIHPKIVTPVPTDAFRFGIDFMAHNIGQTVAANFSFESCGFFRSQTESAEEFLDRIHSRLDTWKQEYFAPPLASLVPKDSEIVYLDEEWKNQALRWWEPSPGGQARTQPVFLAAAFYKTVTSPKVIHLSWRTWYLGHKTNDGKFHPFIPHPLRPIVGDDLCVMPFHTSLMHEEYPANDDNDHRS